MSTDHIHFATGRLAAQALRNLLEELAPQAGFDFTIEVLPITVAALMTPDWIAKHLNPPKTATRILIPGYCAGDLTLLEARTAMTIERGPRDLRDLPKYFGQNACTSYGAYDIEIIAEINHAPQLSILEIVTAAQALADQGADVIDLGCNPGQRWAAVADGVRAVRDCGLRVSIDSFDADEVSDAVAAGAELVLSVNSSNCHPAVDWGCEVVVIPDDLQTMRGLDDTVEFLSARKVPLRIDPILEPIGCGFAESLRRYVDVRRRYPNSQMMMGIGNITELTDADSGPINVLLLGICQELAIRSVLTTQVINWARSSVRECELARRLVHYAIHHRVPPKHIEPNLVVLRDTDLLEDQQRDLDRLAEQIKDSDYRIFAQDDMLHIVAASLHLSDQDPFRLFDQLLATKPTNIDSGHAFYLGFELAKALTANTLGKRYEQDESLDWGFLTVAESHHRLERAPRRNPASG